jgi:hypothetical protein
MDLNSVRDALKREPFVPFTLRLADGRTVPVGHPEFVAMSPRIIIVTAEDSSWKVVEPLLIVSIDYAPQKPEKGNGTARRKRRPPDRGE